MEKGNTKPSALLEALEAELGEPALYRTTGTFLKGEGLGAPLNLLGLVVVTPTRLVYHRYAQSHPLFGGREEEVRWEVPRSAFDSCVAVLPSLPAKFFTGATDRLTLTGAGVSLVLEIGDHPRDFVRAWTLDPGTPKTTY